MILDGDVDGDGRDDLIIFHRSTPGMVGRVDVMLSDGNQFLPPVQWQSYFCLGNEIPLTGDFNGDGRTDIATFLRSSEPGLATGDVYVGLSTGSGFESALWHEYFCIDNEVPVAGDFNGDGRDDIATLTRGATADVYVALSSGAAFDGIGALWQQNFCQGEALPMTGDVNGDGVDDLIAFHRNGNPALDGDVRVSLSFGEFTPAFFGDTLWHDYFCLGTELPAVADVNADGIVDILTWGPDTEDVYVALSDSATFVGTAQRWHQSLSSSPGGKTFLAGNYNGDASADVLALGYITDLIFNGFADARVALCGAHAEPLPSASLVEKARLATDFGYGTMGVSNNKNKPLADRPAREERYLLCVLLAGPVTPPTPTNTPTAFSLTAAAARAMCFGPGHPNMRDYFDEMSGGKFAWRPANLGGGNEIVGPITVGTAPGNTWAFALQQADPFINYALYDFDNNGTVDSSELGVLVFDNFTETGAANRQATIVADGKTVRIDVAAAGHRSAFQNPAHELAHTLGATDLYNSTQAYASGLTLMAGTAGPIQPAYSHLDAWHKMRLGWITPRVFDISEFPGGAWINAAQEIQYNFFQAPVMLYDNTRGTKEHYTIEFRNNAYDDGSDGWAGYDQNVIGTGMATWYAKVGTNNEVTVEPVLIGRGGNGLYDTLPQGDDTVVNSWIGTGPNGILDTVPSGDDGVLTDNTVFSTLTPSTFASRQDSELYNNPAVALSPNWWLAPTPGNPPANIPSGINMRTVAFGGGGYLEWGTNFTPWLDKPLSSSLRTRYIYYLGGNLGIRSRGANGTTYAAVRRADGTESSLITELSPGDTQWDGERAYFRVPLSMPSGPATIRLYRATNRLSMSNAWPITIVNPYHDFVVQHFNAGERTVDALVEPCGDPDGDGLENVLEFILSSNPRNGADGRQYLGFNRGSGSVSFQWSGLTSSAGIFRVTPEYSTNLTTWYDMPEPIEVPSGNFTYYTSSQSGSAAPMFFRLRVECPDYHL